MIRKVDRSPAARATDPLFGLDAHDWLLVFHGAGACWRRMKSQCGIFPRPTYSGWAAHDRLLVFHGDGTCWPPDEIAVWFFFHAHFSGWMRTTGCSCSTGPAPAGASLCGHVRCAPSNRIVESALVINKPVLQTRIHGTTNFMVHHRIVGAARRQPPLCADKQWGKYHHTQRGGARAAGDVPLGMYFFFCSAGGSTIPPCIITQLYVDAISTPQVVDKRQMRIFAHPHPSRL